MVYRLREDSLVSVDSSPYNHTASFSYDGAGSGGLSPLSSLSTPSMSSFYKEDTALPSALEEHLLKQFTEQDSEDETIIRPIPPRPSSPATFLHTRHPHLDAPTFNLLACLLTNYLRKPLLTFNYIHQDGIFRRFRGYYKIHHHYINQVADDIGQVGFLPDSIPGFHHFEMVIVASKSRQLEVDGKWFIYGIKARISACDSEHMPLVIEGEVTSGVAAIMEHRNEEEVCVDVVVRGEMRVKKLEIVEVEGMEMAGEVKIPMNKTKNALIKAWNRVDWIATIMWLRLLAKRTFKSYGETRDGVDVQYWVKQDANLAALEDPKALMKKFYPRRR